MHRVLIIDAYTDAAIMVAETLTAYGHTCRAVIDAEHALTAFDAFAPTVVIIEWTSSAGRDSGVLLRLLEHVSSRGLDVRIIVLSADELPDDFKYRRHVDVYLEKPVIAEKLNIVLGTFEP